MSQLRHGIRDNIIKSVGTFTEGRHFQLCPISLTGSMYTYVTCDCMLDKRLLHTVWIIVKERRRDREGKGQVRWGGRSVPGMHSFSSWLSSHQGDRKAVAQTGRSWPRIHHTHQLEKIISHSSPQAQHFFSMSKSGCVVLLKSLYWKSKYPSSL